MAITFSQQPVAQNKFTGENWTLGASVTGEATTTFTNKPLPITTLEQVVSMAVGNNGKIYAGSGNTPSADAMVFNSSNNGDTWGTLVYDYTIDSRDVGAIAVLSDGVVVSAVGNLSSGSIRVYRDDIFTTTLTTGTPVSEAFDIYVFPNGNIIVGVGSPTNGSGKIFLSTNAGTTFSLVCTGVVSGAGRLGRMQSVCGVDSTTALYTDLIGYVYRTQDSGATWTQVSRIATDYAIYSIGVLGSRVIVWNQTTNTWKQSNDSGSTWVSYVGTSPTTGSHGKINKFGNITCFGELSSRGIWVNDDDSSWVRYELPDASISRVYDVVISNGFVFAGTGTSTGYGRVYRAPLTTVFSLYKSPSTLINSSTETDGTYSFTDVADASDVGNYYITATNAGTTITSDTVSVTLANRRRIIIT